MLSIKDKISKMDTQKLEKLDSIIFSLCIKIPLILSISCAVVAVINVNNVAKISYMIIASIINFVVVYIGLFRTLQLKIINPELRKRGLR